MIPGKKRNKSESGLRWLILCLTCIVMIGNYYCYDIPASLHTQLKNYLPALSQETRANSNRFEILFSLLYSVYSVPNIFLPFLGGFFVDRFGVRICLLCFVFLILVGQGIFSYGLVYKSWGVMLFGRVIYGLGGESLGVANGALLSEWFKGNLIHSNFLHFFMKWWQCFTTLMFLIFFPIFFSYCG